jgi:hypothetical protein
VDWRSVPGESGRSELMLEELVAMSCCARIGASRQMARDAAATHVRVDLR